MNPGAPPPTSKTAARSSGYHQKALAEIRNSLLPFANSSERDGGSSAASTVSSGVSSASGDFNLFRHSLGQLLAQGYEEVNISRIIFVNKIKFGLYIIIIFFSRKRQRVL